MGVVLATYGELKRRVGWRDLSLNVENYYALKINKNNIQIQNKHNQKQKSIWKLNNKISHWKKKVIRKEKSNKGNMSEKSRQKEICEKGKTLNAMGSKCTVNFRIYCFTFYKQSFDFWSSKHQSCFNLATKDPINKNSKIWVLTRFSLTTFYSRLFGSSVYVTS